MRGVISAAGYVPYRRLDRCEIAAVFGAGGGSGTRAVASFDEDTTTMGQASADLALRVSRARPDALWFATSMPAYLEKTNAAAIHSALGLDPAVGRVRLLRRDPIRRRRPRHGPHRPRLHSGGVRGHSRWPPNRCRRGLSGATAPQRS